MAPPEENRGRSSQGQGQASIPALGQADKRANVPRTFNPHVSRAFETPSTSSLDCQMDREARRWRLKACPVSSLFSSSSLRDAHYLSLPFRPRRVGTCPRSRATGARSRLVSIPRRQRRLELISAQDPRVASQAPTPPQAPPREGAHFRCSQGRVPKPAHCDPLLLPSPEHTVSDRACSLRNVLITTV